MSEHSQEASREASRDTTSDHVAQEEFKTMSPKTSANSSTSSSSMNEDGNDNLGEPYDSSQETPDPAPVPKEKPALKSVQLQKNQPSPKSSHQPQTVKTVKAESVQTNPTKSILQTSVELISNYASASITSNNSTSIVTEKEPIVDDLDNFADLSYMDVQINLRLLADVKEGEKLMVIDGKCITVDQRYVQSVRRYWTSDSRERTLRFINHLIESAKKYCNEAVDKVKKNESKQDNLEKLINIQSLLKNATTGLGRMVTTYADDKLNLATIDTFKSTITVFCDQDLKKAISETK